MRHLFRVLIHPATIIMAFGAGYVWLRVPAADRLRFFTIIAMTAVGASELVAAGIGLTLKRHSATERNAHLVTAAGAMLLAFSALNNVQLLPWVVGGVVFAIGGLLMLRATQAAR